MFSSPPPKKSTAIISCMKFDFAFMLTKQVENTTFFFFFFWSKAINCDNHLKYYIHALLLTLK